MKKNLILFSVTKTCLSLLMLSGLCSIGIVSAKAQSPELFDSTFETQSSDNSQLKQKAEKVVQLIQNKDFGSIRESLHPDLQPEWPTEQLEQGWDEMLSETGALKQLTDLKIAESIDSDLVLLTLDFESGTKDLLISFNKNGEIIGINLPSRESIEEIAEQFINDLVTEDYAKARVHLHPYLKEEIFPEQIEEQWQSVIAATGPFQKRANTLVREGFNLDNTNLVLMTLEFADVTEEILITFDKYRNIVGVDLTQNRFE